MKQFALILVIFALANANSIPPTQEGYFAAGREYVYQYEGQVLSGIPDVSKDVSGIKIVAETRIQMTVDNNNCLFRLEQVKLYKMQTETENPAEQQTDDKLQRLPAEFETPIVTQLQKPVEFRYVDGKVFNIVTSKDELVWASNIKKGVMELMMVNIRGTDDLNEPESQRTQPTSVNQQKQHYRVMERGIAGYCESVYNVKVSSKVSNIVDKKVQPQRFFLNIVKTRDLLECEQRTQRSKVSILSGKKCENCEENQKQAQYEQQNIAEIPVPFNQPNKPTEKKESLLKCVSQVRYGISLKDHTKFVIDFVVAEGQHIFRPFGAKGGKAVTFVNQNFVLKNNTETVTDIPVVQDPKEQPEDLSFNFQEWNMHHHDAEEERELTVEDGPHMSQIRTKVKTFLQTIYDGIIDDKITEDAPLQFIYLVKMLKKFTPLELLNIFDRLGKKFADDTEDVKEKKQILLDAFIQVESPKSVEILIDQIGKRNFMGEEASQILSTIALINDPTQETLDHALALCKGPAINGMNADKQVRKTCWLCFGSLVHKACKINSVCTDEKKQEYSLNLLAGIEPTKTEENRRMCLKAIGNAGFVLKTTDAQTDSIDKIAEIIKSKTASVDLRVQAIYSLRRVAKSMQDRVVPTLMPLVKNVDEDHEVRIAAFVITMEAGPKEDIVQAVVSDIQKDKSRQFISYVYSYLETLVANRPFCKKSLTMTAKKAVLLLKPFVTGAQYSKRFMWSPNFFEDKFTLHTEASIIGTPTSPFPISGSVKLGAVVLDREMNIMEVGFHAKCLRDIAEKIFGVARPARKTKEMWKKLNGRQPEEQEKSVTERDLEALDQELPTTQVHSTPAMMKASGYLKFFGNELRTITVAKPTLWSVLEGTSQDMADLEEKMRLGENPYSFRKIFSLGSGIHEVPTEIGLPLQLWVDSAAVLAFDVNGMAVMTPRLTDVLKDKATKLQTVDVQGTVKPKAAIAVLGKMKVSLDNVRTGLYITGSLHTSTFLKGKVNIDVAKRLYHTKFDTPSSEHQAFALHSRPYTFTDIKQRENTGDVAPAAVVQDTQVNFVKKLVMGKLMSPKPITSTWSWGKESVGVEVEVKTSRVPRSCSYTYNPVHVLFNGPIDVNVTARRGWNAPAEVVAYMKLENEFKSQKQYQEFKDKFLVKQHFMTASSSEEDSSSEEHTHIDGVDVQAEQTRIDGVDVQADHIRIDGTDAQVEHTHIDRTDSHDAKSSFRSMGMELLKRFEDWKYDSAKWPFTREEVEDTSHDHIEEVIPDNTKTVELYHIYFNISTSGSWPVRELVSRISIDQQDEFYKAVRFDVMTARKTFRPVRQDQFREETEDIQAVCMQAEIEHPAYAVTLQESEKLQPIQGLPDVALDPKVLFKFSTQWGESCETDQKMEIKARVERSEKQVQELKEETPWKVECLKNIEESNKYTQACKAFRREREELRAVHAKLTHNERVKKMYKTFFYQGLDMAKKMIWGKVQTERAEVHNTDKTVVLTGELEKDNKYMNIFIKHVRGNVKFDKVWIPQIVQGMNVMQPYKLQQHMIMNYGQDAFSGRNINQCKSLKNNTIITFDKVPVNYEQSMCDHILAKDCSNKERFVVLTRKLTPTGTKKVITVYADNTKFQFVPSLNDEDIRTLINNTDVNLPVMKKIIIQDDVMKMAPIDVPTVHIMNTEHREYESSRREQKSWDMPESSSSEEVQMSPNEIKHWADFKDHVKRDIAAEPQQLPYKPKTQFQIVRTKMGDSIMLFAHSQELKVFFDGYNAKVELPQKYKDMQCGLCGDFNGEVANEFVGPNREIYKNARRFGRSFQYTTLDCAQVQQCVPAMEFAFDTEIKLSGNDRQYACITKMPIPHCLPTCAPNQVESVDVEFACIEHEGSTVPFKTSSREKVIKTYNAKPADYKRAMEMATKCARQA